MILVTRWYRAPELLLNSLDYTYVTTHMLQMFGMLTLILISNTNLKILCSFSPLDWDGILHGMFIFKFFFPVQQGFDYFLYFERNLTLI